MKLDELNTQARIEYKTTSQDSAYGTEVVTWALLGVRWCHLQDVMQGRSESVVNGLEMAKNQTRCRLNYCTDIDSSMRITVNRPSPTTYQIVSGPAILGDKERIEVMLEKVSS